MKQLNVIEFSYLVLIIMKIYNHYIVKEEKSVGLCFVSILICSFILKMIIVSMTCLGTFLLLVIDGLGHGFLKSMDGILVNNLTISYNLLLLSMIRSRLLLLIVSKSMNGLISSSLGYLFILSKSY